MVPLYQQVLSSGRRILVYSGDVDGVVPTAATTRWIARLNATTEQPWAAWIDEDGQIGGYTFTRGVTFATVRAAGHMVPRYQGKRAFALVRAFLREGTY